MIEGILHPDSYPTTSHATSNTTSEHPFEQVSKSLCWNPYLHKDNKDIPHEEYSPTAGTPHNGPSSSPKEVPSSPVPSAPPTQQPKIGTPTPIVTTGITPVPGVTFVSGTHFIPTNNLGTSLSMFPLAVCSQSSPHIPSTSSRSHVPSLYTNTNSHVSPLPYPTLIEGSSAAPHMTPIPVTSLAPVVQQHLNTESRPSSAEKSPAPVSSPQNSGSEKAANRCETADGEVSIQLKPQSLLTQGSEDPLPEAYLEDEGDEEEEDEDDDDEGMDDSDPSSPPSPPSPRPRGRKRGRGRGRGRGKRGRPKTMLTLVTSPGKSVKRLSKRGRRRKMPRFTVDPEDHSGECQPKQSINQSFLYSGGVCRFIMDVMSCYPLICYFSTSSSLAFRSLLSVLFSLYKTMLVASYFCCKLTCITLILRDFY